MHQGRLTNSCAASSRYPEFREFPLVSQSRPHISERGISALCRSEGESDTSDLSLYFKDVMPSQAGLSKSEVLFLHPFTPGQGVSSVRMSCDSGVASMRPHGIDVTSCIDVTSNVVCHFVSSKLVLTRG